MYCITILNFRPAKLLSDHGAPLPESDLAQVAHWTRGYSCSDVANLARDAAMGPIREVPANRLMHVRCGFS